MIFWCKQRSRPRFMRASILPENDTARNLDVVISRGGVQPGFRDDKYIMIIMNNPLLDQVELFAWSHWADIKMSDSNVDLSALWFFPQRTRTPPCWNGKVRLTSDVSGHSTIQSLACFRRNQCFFSVGMISYSWVTSGVMRERDKAKKGKKNRSIRKHDYVESWAGFIVIFFHNVLLLQCTSILAKN